MFYSRSARRCVIVFYNEPIESLKLSENTLMKLWGLGIQTVNELVSRSDEELVNELKAIFPYSIGGVQTNHMDVIHDVIQALSSSCLSLRNGGEKPKSIAVDSNLVSFAPVSCEKEKEAAQKFGEQFPLLKLLRDGSPEEKIAARNTIFMDNLEWIKIVTIAAYREINLETSAADPKDFVQETCISALYVIERFDYAKDASLRTYLRHRIRWSVLDMIRELSFLPRSVMDKVKAILTEREEMAVSSQSPAEIEDIANRLDIKTEEVIKIMDTFNRWKRSVSFDQLVKSEKGGKETALQEFIPDSRPTPLEEIERRELEDFVESLLKNADISHREKECLRLYFGLTDFGYCFSMKQIAEHLGVTESRISQIKSEGLRRLRKFKHWETALEHMPSLLPP